MKTGKKHVLAALLVYLFTSMVPALLQASGSGVVVATIDGERITDSQFEQAVYSVGRGSMYHGRPREDDQYREFRRNVLNQLIERRLLLQEARRRGLEPDKAVIEVTLSQYETRYSSTERWKREGEQMLATLRQRFEEDDLLARLEDTVRQAGAPTTKDLRQYYDENVSAFTEPKRDRVSVILLAVQPSAGAIAWQAARAEAQDILRRLADGAKFSEMARMHSSDATAGTGGDMGYLHDGMLSEAAQAEIDKLAVGDISQPVTVLEGIVIFRLVDRQPPRLRAFDEARERVAGLWQRDLADARWSALVTRLHDAADVQVNEEYLASVPVAR